MAAPQEAPTLTLRQLLRLMVERGIPPKIALKKIRKIRPMAVETDAQYHWASQI